MRFPLKLAGSVHARMFLALCIVTIPAFVGLSFYAYHERNEVIGITRSTTHGYAELVAQHENWLLEGYEQALTTIAAMPTIQWRDWPACNRYMAGLITPSSPYVNLGVVGMDGRVLCSGKHSEGLGRMNFSDRHYFQRALRHSGFVASDYIEGRISGLPTLVIASFIKMHDNGPNVLLYAALDLRKLSRAQRNVEHDNGARLTVLDRHGTILFSTRPTLVVGRKLEGFTASVPAAKGSVEAKLGVKRFREGQEWFVTQAHAGTSGDPNALTILYEYPAAGLTAAVNREFLAGIGTFLVLTLLALLAGWQSTQALVGRDIKNLVQAAKRLRQRDFSQKASGGVTSREFADIADQFDKMSEELQFREKQWEAAVRRQSGQNAILKRVARNQPLDETLAALVTFSQQHIAASVASIVLLKPGTRQISQCVGPDLPYEYRSALVGHDAGPLIPAGDLSAGDKGFVVLDDTAAASLRPDSPALENNLRACWSVPIMSSSAALLGVFVFHHAMPHTPTEDQLQAGQMAAGLAAVAIDRDRTANALVQSETEYRLLFETNPHPMWVYNAQSQNIMAVNNRAIAHYGYSREEFLQMRAPDLVVDTAAANNAQHPGAESAIPNLVSQTHRKRNGQDIFVETAYFPLHFMGREAVLALINDITEQRQHNEALQYRAKYDIVTGRLNRAAFSTCVNDAITAAKPADAAFYIIVLGLNEFREINTSLGYMVGDALLKEAGERIHLVAGASPVARVGNDEFAILLEPGTHPTSMLQVLDELLEQIKRPFPANGTQIQITASIGVAQYPADGQSVGLLLQHANSALFQARQESAGYAFYDAANDHLAPERVLLATQLMRGLAERRFELRYQPKVPLHGGLTYGFEALARWNSPDRGLTSPDRFISVIESSDLIHPFTQWVLNTAIEECRKWHVQGFPVSVAVNISARNLLDLLLPERIKQMLGRHDLAPQFLELEITESSIMSNPERSLNVLNKIHDIGVAVIIDDFGTGYSSLAYLQKLPVDSLKIDRSFIVEMDREDDTRPIINSIIEMAHSLNISVTAEGIESRQIMAKLAGMNCDYAQGYHISEPMAADSVIAWLRQNGPGTQPAYQTDEPS